MSMTMRIAGLCPACGGDRLFGFSIDGSDTLRIECDTTECPEPTLVNDLLSKRDQHVHLILFRDDGYTVQHPLIERLRPESLFACDLTDEFKALTGPLGIGMFRVPAGGTLADAEQVDRDEVLFEVSEPVPESEEVQSQPPPIPPAIGVGVMTAIPAAAPLPDGFVEVPSDGILIDPSEHPDIAKLHDQHEPFIFAPPAIPVGKDRRFVLRTR